ncbi:uncharacterized protein K452DRAFT_302170 [Aplosporella prunicola CBS 121167]|uniref:PH domain-containing protein n=1 Tax=Aplosporella prunicola CBS 121167 TaxID=1176127 RepID=A0A6A6B114_9PEZI|nr:uncharacterized protein K452DRAFT_302170 [Aplosporella prunicola CBS 121167]KAF2137258.1 hypothetical protein K452DRAFT_302170 [Aplosporella prunicola CBS 121167]
MAGMEQLQIHSKSYLVRWINVPAGHTISWSIQPHKKSLNFGIFKHPGTKNGETPNLPSTDQAKIDAPGLDLSASRPRASSNSGRNDPPVVDKLVRLGLRQVSWTGRCEADKVSMGRYDVPEGDGGMYGLVFDNTFSKQIAKTATFVLMTHPTNAPPKSGHHLHFSQKFGESSTSLGRSPTALSGAEFGDSTESLDRDPSTTIAADPRPKSRHIAEATTPGGSLFYTGVLMKKRRKRNQGYARRFFSLDFTSSTLSYYQSRQSSALRGAIPLSLAAIGANEMTREISVDSGAEVWHLKATNKKDFDEWKDALERASKQAGTAPSPPEDPANQDYNWPSTQKASAELEVREWGKVEALVGRVSGTRDAVRRLAKDTEAKLLPSSVTSGASSVKGGISGVTSPAESESAASGDYFNKNDDDARSVKSGGFWKRKSSTAGRRSVSGAQTSVPVPGSIPPVPALPTTSLTVPKPAASADETGIHEHVLAILRDLDLVVSEFSTLLAESRSRRAPTTTATPVAEARKSIDSASDDEFFDATGGDDSQEPSKSQFLQIRRDSDEPDEEATDEVSDGESEASSEGDAAAGAMDQKDKEGQLSMYPSRAKDLTPLPADTVQRRKNVNAPKQAPPSLIAFLRKNVGKDLSTIAMPVSANEPTSLLQRVAEQMEYSELLDAAATANPDDGSRILYVMAFAISSFSNSRVKERAIRKPFNPMLGETFELVREDKGYRFLAEKVSHRPVRMACQAEAASWTFMQSPMPVQKFWGKSAELNTDGRARVFIYPKDKDAAADAEQYSWTVATSFLRNIIAGEKYVEPVGTMTVVCESTGAKAVATFKAGGMFAGRSEEVSVQAFAPGSAAPLPLGLNGKWTQSLTLTSGGKPIWSVGPLVDQPEKRYGFTTFAASLNEISALEQGKLAPTDSRLRPDQRAVEEGELDSAEGLKAKLEEAQRQRRKDMEERGEEWKPRFFEKVKGASGGGEGGEGSAGGDEVWRLKGGKEGYWDCRARGEWEGVLDVMKV